MLVDKTTLQFIGIFMTRNKRKKIHLITTKWTIINNIKQFENLTI